MPPDRPAGESGAAPPVVGASVRADGRRVLVHLADRRTVTLHPEWLRERSTALGAIDQTNRQRLFEPTDLAPDLGVRSACVDGGTLRIDFGDGHTASYPVETLLVHLGEQPDPEALPEPQPWLGRPDPFPAADWGDLDDPERFVELLRGLFTTGMMVLHGTPAEPGALRRIAGRFGRISATNFGELFDVRSVENPSDLAYTPVGLAAHTDQPYRRPAPGLQFLHAIVNDAPGGDSTAVDGLAAVEALRVADPVAFDLLSTLDVEFRYDVGHDVVVGRSPIIGLDDGGNLRHLRFSPRLDFAPAVDPDVLDVFYRGRRRLAAHFADLRHHIRFRLAAGDVLVVDNHRVLHGRTPYAAGSGHRHLQGCYIDHDGPETAWRLALRSLAARRPGAGS